MPGWASSRSITVPPRSGSCSVQIKPAAGTWPVYASYSGDSYHYTSSAQGPELYVSCPNGGC